MHFFSYPLTSLGRPTHTNENFNIKIICNYFNCWSRKFIPTEILFRVILTLICTELYLKRSPGMFNFIDTLGTICRSWLTAKSVDSALWH